MTAFLERNELMLRNLFRIIVLTLLLAIFYNTTLAISAAEDAELTARDAEAAARNSDKSAEAAENAAIACKKEIEYLRLK